MRGQKLGCCALYFAVAFLLISPIHSVEQDFDDGIDIEEIPDEPVVSTTDDDGEELTYESPKYDQNRFHFVDHFDNVEESRKRWVKSQATKDDIPEEIAKYDGVWSWEPPQRIVWRNDIGLVLKSKAKHAAIAARLAKEFTFKEDKPLVVQYEVSMQEGQECGGSYIKLLSSGKHTEDLTKFNDKTPYTIMFGPDKCGNDIKMHFIFRHVNPINGSITEKHCRKPKDRLEEPFKDKLPHLYQLIVRPDNTFEVLVDHKIVNEGSLLTAFTPPVNPPREIDDPEDKKPKDWDEREKIPDPLAKKPEDWDDDAPPQIPDPSAVKPDGWLDDEPEMLADPTATKPEDWDNEIDGEWEAPLVENPICEKVSGCGKWKAPLIQNKEYKGKWRATLIDNPNYQGKWAARKIVNPEYFEDLTPFKMTPISAIGIELWSMSSDILFDNLIITDDIAIAKEFAAKSFDIKRKFIDKESETFLNKIVTKANENPWAWKIAIVLIGTPLAYFLYRTFSTRGSKEAAEAAAKKTDELQPEDDEAAAAVDEDGVPLLTPIPNTKKSDLNVEEDVATLVGDVARGSSAENSAEDEAYNENDKILTEESKTQSTGARKRRVRKDESEI